MNKQKYELKNQTAAVIIPTLNRLEHLRTTLESLKNCIQANQTDVYIGLDYPPSDKYQSGYEKVKSYLEKEDFNCFRSFNIFKREENFGLFRNMCELRNYVMQTHDTFITMQDDIEVSKNFLVYINEALECYKNDDNIVAVSGYSYPLKWAKTSDTNALKTNYVAAEWGIGFWKNKFQKLEKLLLNDYLYNGFIKAYKEEKLDLMIDACIKDYSATILNPYDKNSMLRNVCDVSMRIYLPLDNKFVIMPVVSHTRNHGFDGSGLFCGEFKTEKLDNKFADTYNYDMQPIDNSDNYRFYPSGNDFIDSNREQLNSFDRRDSKEMKSIRKKLKTYAVLGPGIYNKYLCVRSLYRGLKFKTKQFIK